MFIEAGHDEAGPGAAGGATGGPAARTLRLRGPWRAEHALELAHAVAAADVGALPGGGRVLLDPTGLDGVDLTGAFFLRRLEARLEAAGTPFAWRAAPPDVLEFARALPARAPHPHAGHFRLQHEPLDTLGRWTVGVGQAADEALAVLGRIFVVLGGALRRPRRLRPTSVFRHVYETGIQAVPIVALIAFLISVIIAYIGAQELKQFGGEVYVVDLVTLSVLRELGVLLTAIIVAGRSGSAFAAEIGVMRLNDEVDALRAMGLNVVETLVLPRVLGLVIALPILTVIADAMGLAGGAVLSWILLDIPFNQFLARAQETIAPTTFWAGLLKAPVFAFMIAMIGTFRGMQVRESSRELGRLTTVAVVESIFMVILVDAIFAVVYWELDF
jgi:phospholipid/cholesterol/gamma-HCH transport system permease protein